MIIDAELGTRLVELVNGGRFDEALRVVDERLKTTTAPHERVFCHQFLGNACWRVAEWGRCCLHLREALRQDAALHGRSPIGQRLDDKELAEMYSHLWEATLRVCGEPQSVLAHAILVPLAKAAEASRQAAGLHPARAGEAGPADYLAWVQANRPFKRFKKGMEEFDSDEGTGEPLLLYLANELDIATERDELEDDASELPSEEVAAKVLSAVRETLVRTSTHPAELHLADDWRGFLYHLYVELDPARRPEHGDFFDFETDTRKRTGPCFVTTVCYGGAHHPDVEALRAFRDDRLSTN